MFIHGWMPMASCHFHPATTAQSQFYLRYNFPQRAYATTCYACGMLISIRPFHSSLRHHPLVLYRRQGYASSIPSASQSRDMSFFGTQSTFSYKTLHLGRWPTLLKMEDVSKQESEANDPFSFHLIIEPSKIQKIKIKSYGNQDSDVDQGDHNA